MLPFGRQVPQATEDLNPIPQSAGLAGQGLEKLNRDIEVIGLPSTSRSAPQESPSAGIPATMGSTFPISDAPGFSRRETVSQMVEEQGQCHERTVLASLQRRSGDLYRCVPSRVGESYTLEDSIRHLASATIKLSDQLAGIGGHPLVVDTLSGSGSRQASALKV